MLNVWLMVDEDSRNEINTCLATNPTEYSGPVDDTMRDIFLTMPDWQNVQPLFKSPVLNSLTYYMYSLYSDTTDIPTMQAEIDYVQDEYTDTLVGGAWEYAGDKVAGYALHADLLDFMPDVWDGIIPPGLTAATVLTDVNVRVGQSPRDFS